MARRSRVRQIVFQVLFEDDLNPKNNPAHGDAYIEEHVATEELVEFAKDLVSGVRRNRAELDRAISRAADNWSLERMAVSDRTAIRIGAYEILRTETPDPVAVDEAIELAKLFGAATSGQFVNGILDRVMREKAVSSEL